MLGVILDTRLYFREHLEEISTKAAKTCRTLERIMINSRGPRLPLPKDYSSRQLKPRQSEEGWKDH